MLVITHMGAANKSRVFLSHRRCEVKRQGARTASVSTIPVRSNLREPRKDKPLPTPMLAAYGRDVLLKSTNFRT